MKLRISVLDLLLLPLLGVLVVPLLSCATLVGMYTLPQFTSNVTEVRRWFIDKGFSSEFVCGPLIFFVMDVPTILTLATFSILLFAMRMRICDLFAVVTLALKPFIDAWEVRLVLVELDLSFASFCWLCLKTHVFIVLALLAMMITYLIARWRMPNTAPTRARIVCVSLLFGAILLSSIIFYRSIT